MNDQVMQRWLFAIPAAGVLIACARFGGGFTGTAALARVGVAALVLAGLALMVATRARVGAGAGRVAHVHGGLRGEIARHEAGHAVAARALGGKVLSAQIYRGDRGGLVQARIPAGPLPAVTFLLAGQVAAGTTRGADADNAEIRRELRGLPRAEQRHITRTATRDARRIVARHGARLRRDTATLTERGRL
jgi:hypothetical protein